MSDELHADAIQRKRETHELIVKAHDNLAEISWINPNGYPVYLSGYHAALLRTIQREAAAILAKHEEAEKELASADRL